MADYINEIREHLFSLSDSSYKDFNSSLIPTLNKSCMIGVRVPDIRKYAKEIKCTDAADRFLNSLPHKFYEENLLHGYLIEFISDFDECINAINRFLPYVDNWAVCDTVSPKVFSKNKDKLIYFIYKWIKSKDTYTVRYGIGMLMRHYLDDQFKQEYPTLVANIKSDDYYINMMKAWYFATALAKQYDNVISYLENKKLDKWTHNKTIRKAIESYRITENQKQYLKILRIS